MDELITASLRRLRLFLIVADTLHVGRAAEQLGVAQPALSQQIKGLEEGLGVKLFHRRKRGIELTTAGCAYRDAVVKLLSAHQAAADLARRTAQGGAGRLSIGYVASAMFGDVFPNALQALRSKSPDLVLDLKEGRIAEICSALDRGEIDVAVVRAPISLGLDWKHLIATRQRLVVALPASHPLVRQDVIAMADLVGEPMVTYNDPDDVGVMQVAHRLAAQAGVKLDVQWSVSATTSILGLVSAGFGYGVVPAALAKIALNNLCFRPLDSPEAAVELWYVWRAESVSPALDHFLADARLSALT